MRCFSLVSVNHFLQRMLVFVRAFFSCHYLTAYPGRVSKPSTMFGDLAVDKLRMKTLHATIIIIKSLRRKKMSLYRTLGFLFHRFIYMIRLSTALHTLYSPKWSMDMDTPD